MRNIYFVCTFFLCLIVSAQEKVKLSGFVSDNKNQQPLEAVFIQLNPGDITTETDASGYYEIIVSKDTYTISTDYFGYTIYSETISIANNLEKNIVLQESSEDILDEIVIDASINKVNIREPQMSVNKLTQEEIKRTPVVLGESDVLKTLLLLPGVSNSGEGSSGFNVRGGGSDQNLLQLDDAVVYNSSHLYGFFSVFNTDIINNVKLYKGGIPARYGGRASSVLNIQQKSGNKETFQANGGIGLLSSRLLLEGPIIKDKMSYMIGGRGSYAHLFLKLTDNESAAYFYDINAKIDYTINKNNRLYFTGYFGRDVFKFSDLFDNKFGNTVANIGWDSQISDHLQSNTSFVYTDYFYGLTLGFVGFNWDSGIVNYQFKQDFKHEVSDKTALHYGLQAIHYTFRPGDIQPDNDESNIMPYTIPNKYAIEPSLYLEAEHEISKILNISYGLRYSMFSRLGEESINIYENNEPLRYNSDTDTYFKATPIGTEYYGRNKSIANFGNFEPRLAVSIALTDESSIKMSYNRMAQYIHLISNTMSATPLDVWEPSGKYIKPQIVDQGAVGYFQNFNNDMYSMEIESFLKLGQNRLDYIDGADLVGNRAIEQVLLTGKTESYGVEFLLRKNKGKLTGWVAYTLSKAMQQTKGRTENEIGINYGEWYRMPHDRTHDLAVVAMYDLSKKWSFSANFILQSGRPVTYPVGRYDYMGIPITSYDLRNNASLPLFHHLDISAIYTRKPDKKKGLRGEWVFSVYNIYNRKNAASISFRESENYVGKNEAVRLSIFGIVPSITYNFKF